MALDIFPECSGGITAAKGFVAGGLYCGIRKLKKDLAVIRSISPAAAAGVFTTNKTQAAPVVLDKQHLQQGAPLRVELFGVALDNLLSAAPQLSSTAAMPMPVPGNGE